MKRFMLFIYPSYYPDGGILDYYGTYDSIQECKFQLEKELVNIDTSSGYSSYLFDTTTQLIAYSYDTKNHYWEIVGRTADQYRKEWM